MNDLVQLFFLEVWSLLKQMKNRGVFRFLKVKIKLYQYVQLNF